MTSAPSSSPVIVQKSAQSFLPTPPTPALFHVNSDTKGVELLQSIEAAKAASSQQATELLRALGGDVNAEHRSCPEAAVLDETALRALKRHIDQRKNCDENNSSHDLLLEVTQAEIEEVIGAPAVASLIAYFGAQPGAFRLRRVEAVEDQEDAGAVVAFHTDFSRRTMQVALNDDTEYDGGRLVFVTEKGLEIPSRPAASATIHTSGVVHGVTALRQGVRYSLYVCQLPDEDDLSYLANPAGLQFEFFARAVPLLERVSDAELARVVATYATFLRAASSTPDTLRVPSLGVEIVWRTHLLMPTRYAKDCAALGGGTVDHEILPAEQYSPTHIAEETAKAEVDDFDFLVAAVRRQQRFMVKMLARRSTFDTPEYLRLCASQYTRFLGLMR